MEAIIPDKLTHELRCKIAHRVNHGLIRAQKAVLIFHDLPGLAVYNILEKLDTHKLMEFSKILGYPEHTKTHRSRLANLRQLRKHYARVTDKTYQNFRKHTPGHDGCGLVPINRSATAGLTHYPEKSHFGEAPDFFAAAAGVLELQQATAPKSA